MYEQLRDLGFNLVPVPRGVKELKLEWKKYQTEKCNLPLPENAAIICGDISGVCVIDIDKPELVDRFFSNFEGVKNNTLVTRTGSGGFHVIVKPKGKMPNIIILNDKNHQHVGEIRGNGSYVIAAGSTHPNGNTYEIISSVKTIGEMDIDLLLIKLKESNIGSSNAVPIDDIIKGNLKKGRGDRNNSLYRLTLHYLETLGFNEEDTTFLMEQWNKSNKPPIQESEFKATLRSAINMFLKKTVDNPTVESETELLLKMKDILPFHEGKIISFDCMIASVDEERTFNKEADFECYSCKDKRHIVADAERKIKTPYCGKCSKRCSIIKKSIKTESVRTVILQEPLEECVGGLQKILYAKITGEYCRNLKNGDRKRIIGKRRSIERNDDFDENDVWVDVIRTEDISHVKPIYPNEEDMRMILHDIKDSQFIQNTLVPSFAPDVIGLNDVKEGLVLSIISSHEAGDNRTESHFCLVGDSSVAKSRLLDFAHEVTHGSYRAVGRGATGVGLTYSVNSNKDKTTFVSAGPVILSNGSCCFIDEFDKMNSDDRSYMHEIMENRTCTVNKGKHHFTTPIYSTIICMANPKKQKWAVSDSLIENINLPPTLLSRFDQIWCILDRPDSILDEQIAISIMKKRRGKINSKWSKELLTKYINYVRKLKPVIPDDISRKIVDFYVTTRKSVSEKGIDPRGLEGISRLAENRAKLFLREVVTEEDVNEVVLLYKKMVRSLGLDPEKDWMDQDKLFSTEKVRHDTKKQLFLDTLQKLKSDDGCVEENQVVEELSKTPKFDELKAREIFDHYIGKLYLRRDDGRYKLS